jgi:hypothetical protein
MTIDPWTFAPRFNIKGMNGPMLKEKIPWLKQDSM